MSRRFPFGWIILAVAIIIVVSSVWLFPPSEFSRFGNIVRIRNSPSDLYAALTIHYDHPPIYEESYEMVDRNGVSTFHYLVRAYAGREITITAPPEAVYDVSFFFGKLVNDGVWDIPSRPPRGDTSIHYSVTVRQTVDFKHGERTVTFTDPHYWATTAGHQFEIHLDRNKPVPNLLQLRGTTLQDPRYEQIVGDFRAFGSDAFRENVAKARAALSKGS